MFKIVIFIYFLIFFKSKNHLYVCLVNNSNNISIFDVKYWFSLYARVFMIH